MTRADQLSVWIDLSEPIEYREDGELKQHVGPVSYSCPAPTRNGPRNKPLYRTWLSFVRRHIRAALVRAGRLEERKDAKPVLWLGPVQVQLIMIFARPDYMKKPRRGNDREWHIATPDSDNVLKGVKDAATGLVYRDDAQVSQEKDLKGVGRRNDKTCIGITFTDLTLVPFPRIQLPASMMISS